MDVHTTAHQDFSESFTVMHLSCLRGFGKRREDGISIHVYFGRMDMNTTGISRHQRCDILKY